MVMSIIGINKTIFDTKYTNDFYGQSKQLKRLFDMLYEREEDFHLGKLNLKIGDYVKTLDANGYLHDLPTFLHFEGTSNLILAAQIEQFLREMKNMQTPSSLTKSELKRVKVVIDKIRKQPEKPHSVHRLCLEA